MIERVPGQRPALQLPVLAVAPVESVTVIVNENGPVAEGVPVISPVDALRLKPVGKEPAVTANVYGPVPPVTVTKES